MPHLDPTALVLVLLAVSLAGSRLRAMRDTGRRLLFGASLVGTWAALLAYESSGTSGAAMFGWSDEHQVVSELQRLQLLVLTVDLRAPFVMNGITVALLLRPVLDERGLRGQLTASLRVVAQLPENLITFRFTGTSDTAHGPPAARFAVSVATAG